MKTQKPYLKSEDQIKSRFKEVLVLLVMILFVIIISSSAQAQHKSFSKSKTRHYTKLYNTQIKQNNRACTILEHKRNEKPKSSYLASNKKPKYKPMAEIDPPVYIRTSSNPTPSQKPEPVHKEEKSFENMTITEKHKKEDEVLKRNNLPVPTSGKHEQIRKLVANNLQKMDKNEPVPLEPLFFNFDKDELSFMNMDAFLIAVEYALQGRHVLIEGHTDSRGKDDYNVQLSIKRVQKIRELMIEMGVPDDHISVVGYGEEIAMHDNTTEEGRQKNRRVDFTVF